jgi:hypothetical protein
MFTPSIISRTPKFATISSSYRIDVSREAGSAAGAWPPETFPDHFITAQQTVERCPIVVLLDHFSLCATYAEPTQ